MTAVLGASNLNWQTSADSGRSDSMIKRLARRALRKTLGLEVSRVRDARLPAYTITAQTTRRLVYFRDLLTQVKDLDGDIVECGVGNGNTLFALSVLSSLLDKERHIYGFDSFQGEVSSKSV